MKKSRFFRLLTTSGFSLALCVAANAGNDEHWVSTWTAVPDQAGPVLGDVTIRQIVRTSVGGSKVRLRLSNVYGSSTVTIASAHLAIRATGSAIENGSDHVLTFNGATRLKLAKGESVLCDPLDMNVTPLQELAVSLYLPAQSAVSTIHGGALESAYLKRGSDATTDIRYSSAKTATSRYFLTDVEVSSGDQAGTIVALGDATTNGAGSTENTHRRWTDILATRLQTDPTLATLALINSGIRPNRSTKGSDDPLQNDSALVRFERDALEKPGVRWVILNTDNDEAARSPMTAAQIIDGMKSLIAHAHVKGIKVLGTTSLPIANADSGTGKHLPAFRAIEARRVEVNTWIRNAQAFDVMIDFDQILRDPAHPERMLPKYASGDHRYPNDTGHRVLAEAFDLHKFSQPSQ